MHDRHAQSEFVASRAWYTYLLIQQVLSNVQHTFQSLCTTYVNIKIRLYPVPIHDQYYFVVYVHRLFVVWWLAQ